MYIYFFNKRVVEGRDLIIIDINLFTRNNLVDLIKERSEFKLIISDIYIFKIFKLNYILFFYIY